MTDSIQKLKLVSVKVHAVALSKNTDEVLLKRIALETGGSFEIAETAQQLQKLFFKMFERATKPDSVRLEDNQFVIDKSIKEMTLLIFRQPGSKHTLLYPPESNAISAGKPGNSVWRSDDGYDLITIKKPETGLWKFDAEIDPDNRLMIVTDLKLKLDALPAYLMPFEPVIISAELYNNDRKIKKNSFLRFVEFKLLHLDAEGTEYSLRLEHTRDRKNKGLYGYSFEQGLEEGSYSFVVSADSRTFNRSKRVNIEIQWPVVVKFDPVGEPGNYALSIKAREEYLHPESLIATVRLEAPDGTGQDIIMEQSSVGWTANIKTFQNGIYQALIHINGETATGKNIQLNLGKFPLLGVYREAVVEEPDPAVKEIELVAEITEDTGTIDQPDWILTAIIVGLANFGLILGGFVAWFIWRRKKSAPELTLEDEGVNA